VIFEEDLACVSTFCSLCATTTHYVNLLDGYYFVASRNDDMMMRISKSTIISRHMIYQEPQCLGKMILVLLANSFILPSTLIWWQLVCHAFFGGRWPGSQSTPPPWAVGWTTLLWYWCSSFLVTAISLQTTTASDTLQPTMCDAKPAVDDSFTMPSTVRLKCGLFPIGI